ncbi:chaperone protein dnaJ C76, chloroplastic [Impatiens glandulifera]|uniref:chaperone protein dnaJ C76, chloroplastic n=1 Tax=Impatiens glandulifera TaxID=253017 RepID=UPI001FB0610D|nr:chaperone protein dnaJ C76, chloroplastic [Impatiens glandulifera]
MRCSSSHNKAIGIGYVLHTIPIHANHNTSSSVSGQFRHLTLKNPLRFHTSASPSPFTVSCREKRRDDIPMSPTSAYDVLGIVPGCSSDELKAAFRTKVKEFHPDVRKDVGDSDFMIRRVIEAYEILSKYNKTEIIERECLDPFDKPECEAYDIFVNEIMCIGNGCPYSCVQAAAHAFSFTPSTRTARATSQGHGEDYKVQLAVGQCPRSCIHYVTPSQRIILEELLDCILGMPFDTSVEAELLYSLIVKAKFENNRYRKPKKQEKASTGNVDWL